MLDATALIETRQRIERVTREATFRTALGPTPEVALIPLFRRRELRELQAPVEIRNPRMATLQPVLAAMPETRRAA